MTAPVPRLAIVAGRLMAAFVLGVAQVLFFVVIGLLFGATMSGGVLGVLLVLVLGGLCATAFASLGLSIAFRVRQASVVQGLFPFLFVILYLSSAFFPRQLLQSPANTLAAVNPLSYLAEGLRTPIAFGLEARPLLEAFAVAAGVIAVGAYAAARNLSWRLADAA